MITDSSFRDEKAPCGRVVDGERRQDRDVECLLTDQVFTACGCVVIRHEVHDGAFSLKVVRHDGKILVEQMNSEHCA